MATFLLYFFPFAIDIVVSLLLFVGRHSLATIGASEAEVGSIPLLFGVGYFLAGPLMRSIISRSWAKLEMLIAIGAMAILSAILANAQDLIMIQILFFLVPISASLFFNAFQAYMLGISTDHSRPLGVTVSLYTFAWSMGFALGPFICGMLGNSLTWSQMYYLASISSIIIAIMVALFRPKRADRRTEPKKNAVPKAKGPVLYVPGWMGVVIGLLAWMVIATYWPLIAVSKGFSPAVKGMVEFAFAASQSLGALALILVRDWQHRPVFLPLFGVFGVAALLLFGASSTPVFYIAGASLMGLFMATNFIFSVYHCMLEVENASKRIAINEMMVGLGYVAGPIVAALLHRNGMPFGPSFVMAAFFVAILVSLRTGVAYWIRRRGDPQLFSKAEQ
jgi:predicted MFS family arabinose efflux permease